MQFASSVCDVLMNGSIPITAPSPQFYTHPWPLPGILSGVHGDGNFDRVLFSLSDWTHVLAIHAGEPVFTFICLKSEKIKISEEWN